MDRCCYTFTRRPVVLVHCSDFREIDQAIAWEKQLKGWSRAKKQALIENDWPLISRLGRNGLMRLCEDPPSPCHPEPVEPPRCHPVEPPRCHPEPVEG
jgi:hypothetical protein